ncbi:MAG TPA: VWA domain-containing protein [Allosphingosinicella sp.]|nr:VWA domain-containing protein [Allosphingosinicella sp.]
MATRSPSGSTLLIAALVAACAPHALLAQEDPPQEEEVSPEGFESIVVTGSRIRQGGMQDIRHFRSVAAEGDMPRPESLTAEGLMGEHELALEARRPCAQLLCLDTEAMPAAFPARPEDRMLVGLTFASNIDSATWRRDPLNLVAVVDKSGSMSGEPLELVRQSLRQIVGQMGERDQLSIVLYGDTSHVHLAPTSIAGGGRQAVLASIDAIASAGSTNMEEGLKIGYSTAFGSEGKFRGSTRVMLFTDEQPNVGATDSKSFMGMAEAASRRGIGLTTIGVGVQFGAELGMRMSSVRGGNLFFLSNEEEVKSVFEKQLDTMVSEVAHHVRITLTPRSGYKLTGIFGVPDGLMTDVGEGAVTITVPTAFLSTNGGGIFASIGKSGRRANLPSARLDPGSTLLDLKLAYVAARGGKRGTDRLAVAAPQREASPALRRAHLVVDEYLSLKAASLAFHREGDPKKAFQLLSAFQGRLERSGLDKMEGEKTLVAQMLKPASLYSGYGGEPPKAKPALETASLDSGSGGQTPAAAKPLELVGSWKVSRVDGPAAIRNGDRFTFTGEGELMTRSASTRRADWETEAYAVDGTKLIVTGEDSKDPWTFSWRATPTRLTLASEDGTRLLLRRVTGAGEGTD